MARFCPFVSLVLVVTTSWPAPSRAAPAGGRSSDPPESTDVVIVGAGLAGLVTAYELQKAGIRTHILEAQDTPGGRISTADYGGGLVAEYGMQEIWENNPIRRVADELGVTLEMSYARCAHSTFLHDGKVYPDTGNGTMRAHWESFLSADELRALADWLANAKDLHHRAKRHLLADARARELQDISYQQWVTSAPGLSPLARAWLRLHVEAELGTDWNRVSALFALLEMEIFFDGGAACFAVQGGNSEIVDALAAASGPLTTSAPVTAVRRWTTGEGHVSVEISYIRNDEVRTIAARRVVLAIPFYRLHQILIDPPLSEEHEEAIRTLGRGHYVVVHLVVRSEATSLTLAGEELAPNVVLTNGPLGYLYGFVAENDSRAVFSLLVHGEHARRFHESSRSTKLAELLAEVDALLPGLSEHVVGTHIYTYHPAAIAIWGPGRSPIDDLSLLLRRPSLGLHLAGDYTLGAHSDSAVRSGMNVAEQIVHELAAIDETPVEVAGGVESAR